MVLLLAIYMEIEMEFTFYGSVPYIIYPNSIDISYVLVKSLSMTIL